MKFIDQKFSQKLKLKSKKDIDILFQKGEGVFSYPFMMVYLEKPNALTPLQMGVSVRKKDFKKAVDRNFIKRQMRECLRKNKNELHDAFKEKPHILMLIYSGKDKMSASEMELAFDKLLKKLPPS